jgi:putative transposase
LIERLPPAKSLLADAAYDSNAFHEFLTGRGTTPVIKQNPRRKHLHPFDKAAYKGRNIIERAFSHLKDWRRVATRYDKLARNFCSTVIIAAILLWWIGLSPEPSLARSSTTTAVTNPSSPTSLASFD